MKQLQRWLVSAAYTSRPTLYIVGCGIMSLLAIPSLGLIPDNATFNPWVMRITGYLILMAFTVILIGSIIRMYFPATPVRQPSVHTEMIAGELQDGYRRLDDPEEDTEEPPTQQHKQLSTFARGRIAKQHPGLENSPVLLERRLSATELFVQLEKREPIKTPKRDSEDSDKEKNQSNKKRGRPRLRRRKYKPGTTIYSKSLALLAAVWLFGTFVVLMLTADKGGLREALSVVCVLCFIGVVITFLRLLHRLSRWYYWRLVVLGPNPAEDLQGKVVLIDKPRFFPGGIVQSIDLDRVALVSSSTARLEGNEHTIRSIVAGYFGIEWVDIDTEAQRDERFKGIGPLRNPQHDVALIDKAASQARRKDS